MSMFGGYMKNRLLGSVVILVGTVGKGWSEMAAPKKSKLSSYQSKRSFNKTPEPKGVVKKRTQKKKPIFVIQRHDASHLHYDLRLEIDDVLVSWAVPKGPSTNPRIKRLAIQTEDHPMEYATFEGNIPEGEYGGGSVMVWDRGTYTNIKEDGDEDLIPMKTCLKKGTIEIAFYGTKMHGNYALIRTNRGEGVKKQWLLIKMKDEYADAKDTLLKKYPDSVKTGRSQQEIENEALKTKKKGSAHGKKNTSR